MRWQGEPAIKRGRREGYRDASVQSCLTIKTLFGMALRKTTGIMDSLLRPISLKWNVLDFSTICRRQTTLAVNFLYGGSNGALRRRINSSGIKVGSVGECNARNHGGSILS